ncbi:LytR/AlgR family response regulator transcription factor [Aquimarina mytili]|uniref:Response regulator transcription factor n=1 Tax=Aquimarina mytili TaxID=874423 RepID=A0A936ZVM8_9FLAO|nr:LytTR family DNA-binding domain-containing protein [Aquimarina mytili]MBL0685503.1 response regulator transcription factor [Aquimarina mytili]
MSAITCFIVEDDPQALDYASSLIRKYGNINILGTSDTIKEAAVSVKKLQPDFLILDVFLTDGNAFEFLALFDTIDFKIIFTTSYAKYAIDAFKFSALDYLLKPYDEQEMITALQKVDQDIHKENYKLQLKTLLQNFSNQTASKKIVLKNADAIHIIKTEDILFAQSDNNYTTFFLTSGKEILVSKSLKSFEEKLSEHNFFRVHQSFLINLTYISSFDKRNDQIILDQSHPIPVAQSRKQKLITYIENL